jgi:heptose III glucuronosyltransferase
MSRPTLSVVVPVYNVARYLPRCLESLVNQSRRIDEIIVVDDGSTDDCPQILAGFTASLPQMRVIRQDNAGLSVARNVGMSHATGEFLAFVDSDDFVDPEIYKTLLGVVAHDDLDMVICNANYHFEGREPDRPIYEKGQSSVVMPGAAWLGKRLREDRLLHMVWMHLYRRSFVDSIQLQFVPGLIHEDVIWTTRALVHAARVRYLDRPLYNYRIPVRTFTPEQNRKRLAAIARSSVVNARTLLEIAEKEIQDDSLRLQIREQAVDGAFSVFHKIEKIPDREWQRSQLRDAARDGFFPLLWRSAVDWRQRRKVARNYLRYRMAILGGRV